MDQTLATRKDYYAVAIIGFFFGLLTIPIVNNLHVLERTLGWFEAGSAALIFSIFAVIALGIAALVGKKFPALYQFAKFAAVGALGTFIDLGVLNGLIAFFGRSAGVWYAIFKALSFLGANVNNYFWNKYWTFASQAREGVQEYIQFLLVSLIGLVVNVGTAYLIITILPKFIGGISEEVWANIGALGAVVFSFAWNFIGYKFFVFKPTSGQS